MGSLNQDIIEIAIPFDLPPLPVQRRIADILSAYDDLIENNNRRIAILEEMAQNLYREWFVHFRFPGHEHVKMVDSELGPIPEGWEVSTIGGVSDNFDRLRKPLSKLKRANMLGDIPYYGAAKVIDHVNSYIFHGKFALVAEDGSVINGDGTAVTQFVDGRFWANNQHFIFCKAERFPQNTSISFYPSATYRVT